MLANRLCSSTLVEDTMEMDLWKLTIANKAVHIMGIYHPPKSISNNFTMNLIFEELSRLSCQKLQQL